MNTETKTIRILTADHHALLRHGIASLVEIEPDMELVAQAATGREAIIALKSCSEAPNPPRDLESARRRTVLSRCLERHW